MNSGPVEQKEGQQEPVLTDEDLPRLEQEMVDLQTQFEKAVVAKHEVDQQRNAITEILRHGHAALQGYWLLVKSMSF